MKRSLIILLLLYTLPNAHALDNTSVYVEGVQMYNIFLAEKPVFLNNSIDYTKAYLRVLSWPGRGECVVPDLFLYARVNNSKLKEIETIIQENKLEFIKISREIFTFKDQSDYNYVVEPWGILVTYVIPEGRKLTIEEFHEERRKFLNETTNRIKELFEIKYNLECCARNDRYKTYTGYAPVYIVKVSNLSNYTFQQLMKGTNYKVVKEPDEDIITLYSNDSKYWDVIFIKGRWSPPILYWYGYLALLEYNRDKAKKIEDKLNITERNLEYILGNLNQNLSSEEVFKLLNDLINITKELYGIKNSIIKKDIKGEIDSLDAFVKISEESLKSPHAKWFEALFKEDVEKYCIKSLGTRVSRMNSKYNFLKLERKDLFDIAVATYSTTLQRENFEKEWEGMQKQIKIALAALIVSIMISIVSFYFSRKSAKEQIQKMDKQIQEMKKLTDKQIKASREDMKTLIEELKNLKQKEK